MEQLDDAMRRLRFHIQDAKMDQVAVARQAKVDPGQLSKMLKGPAKGGLRAPHIGMFFGVCDALGLDPVYVWHGRPKARLASDPPPPSGQRSSNPPPRK